MKNSILQNDAYELSLMMRIIVPATALRRRSTTLGPRDDNIISMRKHANVVIIIFSHSIKLSATRNVSKRLPPKRRWLVSDSL